MEKSFNKTIDPRLLTFRENHKNPLRSLSQKVTHVPTQWEYFHDISGEKRNLITNQETFEYSYLRTFGYRVLSDHSHFLEVTHESFLQQVNAIFASCQETMRNLDLPMPLIEKNDPLRLYPVVYDPSLLGKTAENNSQPFPSVLFYIPGSNALAIVQDTFDEQFKIYGSGKVKTDIAHDFFHLLSYQSSWTKKKFGKFSGKNTSKQIGIQGRTGLRLKSDHLYTDPAGIKQFVPLGYGLEEATNVWLTNEWASENNPNHLDGGYVNSRDVLNLLENILLDEKLDINSYTVHMRFLKAKTSSEGYRTLVRELSGPMTRTISETNSSTQTGVIYKRPHFFFPRNFTHGL